MDLTDPTDPTNDRPPITRCPSRLLHPFVGPDLPWFSAFRHISQIETWCDDPKLGPHPVLEGPGWDEIPGLFSVHRAYFLLPGDSGPGFLPMDCPFTGLFGMYHITHLPVIQEAPQSTQVQKKHRFGLFLPPTCSLPSYHFSMGHEVLSFMPELRGWVVQTSGIGMPNQ